MAGKFPGMSPFLAFNDNPIYFTDPLGLQSQSNGGGDGGGKWHKYKKEGTYNSDTDIAGDAGSGTVDVTIKLTILEKIEYFAKRTVRKLKGNIDAAKIVVSAKVSNLLSQKRAIDNSKVYPDDENWDWDLTGRSNGDVWFIKHGNGSFVEFDGSQLFINDQPTNQGNYGSDIKSPMTFGEEPLYEDASLMPGRIVGNLGAASPKVNLNGVKVNVKVTFKGKTYNATHYLPGDIDDFDDLFDLDGIQQTAEWIKWGSGNYDNGEAVYKAWKKLLTPEEDNSGGGQTPEIKNVESDSIIHKVKNFWTDKVYYYKALRQEGQEGDTIESTQTGGN